MSKRNKSTQALSRRSLLKGLGVGLAGATGVTTGLMGQARAQGEMSGDIPLAMQRFDLGDMRLSVLQEAALQLQPSMFGGGAAEGAVSDLLAENNLPSDAVAASANVMLIDHGGELSLIDTGTGQTLTASLEAIGVSPSDISAVLFSHFHGDHVGGASSNGQMNFPNATYYFPQAEWDFLQGAAADNDNAQSALDKLQPAADAGQLSFFADGDEPVAGVRAAAAFGHTPGHHVFSLQSGDQSLTFVGDAMAHFLVSPMHPDWAFAFDSDPEAAAETRRALLERAASEGLRIAAYHFPFPGLGYISREGETYRFLAT